MTESGTFFRDFAEERAFFNGSNSLLRSTNGSDAFQDISSQLLSLSYSACA
jgi:hypothetical protein